MGWGTGWSCRASSWPETLASDMKSGGRGGNWEAGSRREGGANPAMPLPSNMPDTDVTQQNGENDPNGPTCTKSEHRNPRTVVPCAYVDENRRASFPLHESLVSGTNRETDAGGRFPNPDGMEEGGLAVGKVVVGCEARLRCFGNLCMAFDTDTFESVTSSSNIVINRKMLAFEIMMN
mmetsp:Transcript_20095/g.42156  ORF Transcript_20095/g.42156 Transcript_20095/m.42156 type:complete len:178 (+) Transcript_20095:1110-1643(+)